MLTLSCLQLVVKAVVLGNINHSTVPRNPFDNCCSQPVGCSLSYCPALSHQPAVWPEPELEHLLTRYINPVSELQSIHPSSNEVWQCPGWISSKFYLTCGNVSNSERKKPPWLNSVVGLVCCWWEPRSVLSMCDKVGSFSKVVSDSCVSWMTFVLRLCPYILTFWIDHIQYVSSVPPSHCVVWKTPLYCK